MTLLLLAMLSGLPDAGTAVPTPARPYVAELLAKVRDGSVDTERERDFVKPEDVPHLAKAYFAAKGWKEKRLIFEVVQDSRDPALEPVMWDSLNIPDCKDDTCWWVRAAALCWLDGDFDKFDKLYTDRQACRAELNKKLKEAGKRKK